MSKYIVHSHNNLTTTHETFGEAIEALLRQVEERNVGADMVSDSNHSTLLCFWQTPFLEKGWKINSKYDYSISNPVISLGYVTFAEAFAAAYSLVMNNDTAEEWVDICVGKTDLMTLFTTAYREYGWRLHHEV